MVIEIISIIVSVIALICIVTIVENNSKKNKSKMSFKESLDLTELPIVTFSNNNKKLNFLLDTGSNISYINELILKDYKYELVENGRSSFFGIDGKIQYNKICSMKVQYKEYTFDVEFGVHDFESAFDIIKTESGVQVHGILGNSFFQKYKYILDFESLIAYMK